VTAFTEDRFLNGRIVVRQSEGGFRSGLDAVMLAAAIPETGGEMLELGAGAGAASLCVAARLAQSTVTGLEIDKSLVDLANETARANGMNERVRFVAADVLAMPGDLKRDFSHVFANPPFHGSEAGAAPPDPGRGRALHDEGRLAEWLEIGLKRTVSGGSFTTIVRADRLGEALSLLPEAGVVIFPLWPRSDEPAKRVIVQARNGSGAPPVLLPGLVLHEADGRYTAEADAILRGGASLALARPRL
jgi:tRNA1Val (adenine37-N6)-methyltransferase